MNDWLNAALNVATLIVLVYLLWTLLRVIGDAEVEHERSASRVTALEARIADLEQERSDDFPE